MSAFQGRRVHTEDITASHTTQPGALSRQHAQAFLRTVCGWAPASDLPTNGQFVEALA